MILVNDVGKHKDKYRTLIDSALKRVLKSGLFVQSAEVNKFENHFSRYLGVGHCVSVGNGTDALELALRALGIAPGDRVATVANAGFYSSSAIITVGAVPVFMDVDYSTFMVPFNEIKRTIESGIRALIITHLFGRIHKKIEEIAETCKANGVILVEDCAQAHGAKINGVYAGCFGEVGCFSFYPTKNLGGLGDGGAVVTNSSKTATLVKELSQYGWSNKYKVNTLSGRNSRLDEIQAAILVDFLPYLDEWNTLRLLIAKRYSSEIKSPHITLPEIQAGYDVVHLYVVRSKWRDDLRKFLQKRGINTDTHYPIPDHRQPAVSHMFASIQLKNTEVLANQVLTLPCFPELTTAEVDKIIKEINEWAPQEI